MKCLFARPVFWLLAGIGLAVSAEPARVERPGSDQRPDVRAAVETHRASRLEEVRREEVMADRRLTAEQRAELREQLRRQWAAHGETAQTAQAAHTAEPQPAERIAPGSVLPRIQRD